MFEALGIQYLLRKRNKKDNFSNNNDTNNENNNTANLVAIINIGIIIFALVLFFKCKNLKGNFNLLEFLAALCYPIFYLIYRLVVPPNEQNCKSQVQKDIERMQQIKQAFQ